MAITLYTGLSQTPRRIWPVVFVDEFRHRGNTGLPGSDTLPDEWTVASGSFTTANEINLVASAAGTLVYSGTPLNELLTGLPSADFGWAVRVWGQENLIFTIQARRSSSTKYVGLTVNFVNDTLTVTDVDGTTSSSTVSYNLATDKSAYYSFELWLIGNQEFFVFVNENPVLSGTTAASHAQDYGFALDVSGIPTGPDTDGAEFAAFGVNEIMEQFDPDPIIDGSDLFLEFRQQMKNEIENPSTRNWESFQRARKLWDKQRNVGKNHLVWTAMGYPIREPLPEEWFRNDQIVRRYHSSQIMPWIEINGLVGWEWPEWMATAIKGLINWSLITDNAIITTRAGFTDVYTQVLVGIEGTGMSIIPGLKTSSVLDDRFDDVAKWALIADEVTSLTAAANSEFFVFEHEGALNNHVNNYLRFPGGEHSVDLEQLKFALGQLPQDIKYIWYPGFTGLWSADPENYNWTSGICLAANEALPDVDFTDLTWSAPQDFEIRFTPGTYSYNRLIEINSTISNDLLPMVYFYGPGTQWWMDEGITTILEKEPDKLIIYTGGPRWIAGAINLSALISSYRALTMP